MISNTIPAQPDIAADSTCSSSCLISSSGWALRAARHIATDAIAEVHAGIEVAECRHWGDGLFAGETISTGSMTGMLPIRLGQRVCARFGDLATVEIAFEG